MYHILMDQKDTTEIYTKIWELERERERQRERDRAKESAGEK